MGTASIHEGIRRMRFSDLLDRTEAKELTQEAASEVLGISVRSFQRWADALRRRVMRDGSIGGWAGDRRGGHLRKSWRGCWGCSGTSTRTSR